ncbi:SMP-30/gluconolactonase/LRE family protein [Mycolicibacterium celeriflavum]|uniref:Gluconolaconase n=1 Tax=Mycolicibacterium celeriflavum TaxID=1249101 RepID=A0A1X0BUZ0_MYCCF|nr:SMP-30/gluconolactonase/LRE family protein [Mycolicibacterium celeriflavum]MCV7237520.1 SMP-30/gluconolactonase/LRE family protein [Mycolicibacterium celeriflavum]ORA47786.1 gluconolaconase [Mycolicibacterium celeriflavum]BBY45845.1 gluconolaconase [Mycolicibacterium celeriflavum]
MTPFATSSQEHTRYSPGADPAAADGWRIERVTAPSRLFGANGLRTGPDGRVYIAQVTGSQISALDLGTGALDTVSAKGGDIVAPDDVAFDSDGNLYATEVMDGRVSVRLAKNNAGGRTRVLRDDLPCANGITVHQDRLFINECREGGRLMELDRSSGAERILLENLPSPNAMEVGPDGLLYYPLMTANEIWRIDPAGGEPQRVAADLGVPDALKFDSQGRIVSTQVASGQVLRIDPRSGERTVLAQLNPGLDNLAFVGDRLFASNFTGEITEVLGGGETRTLLAFGLNWPLDLAMSDGDLYVADGTYFYRVGADGSLQTVGMLFSPGYPGFLRGLAPAGAGVFVVATSGGQIARYRQADGETDYLADGFDQLYGVALGPDDTIVFAELGTGRVHALRSGNTEVLASGLKDPVGVAFDPAGRPLVAETGAGRVVSVSGTVETVVDGLQRPQGIAVADGVLYIVDAGAKEVVAVDLNTNARATIASGLPVGPPPGVEPKPLKGMPPFSGPQGPFAGITVAGDGTLYVSADGEGSVLALRRT